MQCSYQPRVHDDPVAANAEVVIAAAKIDLAQLCDAQPPTFRAVQRRQLFHVHDAVNQALKQLVAALAARIVEQHDSATALDQLELEREQLTTKAQRALREQAQLRARVDHDPTRTHAIDLGEQRPHALTQLDLGRHVQCVLVVLRRAAIGGDRQLVDRNAIE
jgi:hypothetical protein